MQKEKLRVLNSSESIFDKNEEYVIPLYQRGFAWGDKQLEQLVDDISDINIDGENVKDYYIGSLIVSKHNDKYEVIDGQQRLTSLFMLLHCLGLDPKPTLKFACRDKANYTLNNIKKFIGPNEYTNSTKVEDIAIDWDKVELNIKSGIEKLKAKIEEVFKDQKIDKEKLKAKLEKVIIFRIEVPEHTDLNRYFEIMNTRGVQLEHHDIVKAKLMSEIEDEQDKKVFAKIWEACTDMTGYVQMHFKNKDKGYRELLFGTDWNQLPNLNLSDIRIPEFDKVEIEQGVGLLISDIIKKDLKEEEFDDYDDIEGNTRFESIIDFPFFLLHVLNVYMNWKGITIEYKNGNTSNSVTLDDKKLKDAFDDVVEYGVYIKKLGNSVQKTHICEDKGSFSKEFIMCLLKTRFLFDKFIIKREFTNKNVEGNWSLKMLEVVNLAAKYKKGKYIDSYFNDVLEKKDDFSNKNLMIQAAMRVSYTAPRVMHWITNLLNYLYDELCTKSNVLNTNKITLGSYCEKAEKYVQKEVISNFFEQCANNKYEMGLNTHRIVFNYLDYLLWKKSPNDNKDFEFIFRNSVEHWYPQNPTECDKWEEVDRFGNLCLLQCNVNARFSNLPPEAKKVAFKDRIKKASLKLQKMSDETVAKGAMPAWRCWKDYECKLHEEKMLEILNEACGLKTSDSGDNAQTEN